jgi:hypothetical protein
LQTILTLLLKAKFRSEKVVYLNDINVELEILRFQIRLAVDLVVMPLSSQEHATKLLLGIGAQIGGWLKSKGSAPEPRA